MARGTLLHLEAVSNPVSPFGQAPTWPPFPFQARPGKIDQLAAVLCYVSVALVSFYYGSLVQKPLKQKQGLETVSRDSTLFQSLIFTVLTVWL